MYGDLTDRACRVILEMQGEAFLLDHDHTGTEHLLIAIVEVNDDAAGPVLNHFGVTAERLRREVRALVNPGIDFDNEGMTTFVIGASGPDEQASVPDLTDSVLSDREFTPRLMKCLTRLAHFETRDLGDDHVGPEHLLLGLLRAGNGVALQALHNLGVDTSELMRAVYEKIADDPAAEDATASEPNEEERQAALEMRQERAQSRMRPED